MWSELDARARGLSTRLIGHATLAALARSPDLSTVAVTLGATRAGFTADLAGSAPEIARAAVAIIAERVRTLARWAGPGGRLLAPIFDNEDRRSIATVVRGAVEGAPAAHRIAGLLPTPSLPERALDLLARQSSASAIAALLSAWHHPLAPALAPEIDRARPDLFAFERRLAQRWAALAVRASRHGDRALRTYIAHVIDVENAWTALVATAMSDGRAVDDVAFLAGGRRLDAARFARCIAAGDATEAARVLATAFDGTALGEALRRRETGHASLERAALEWALAEQRVLARREPLGAAPTLAYVLRLHAELDDVRRIASGIALAAPAVPIAAALVAS